MRHHQSSYWLWVFLAALLFLLGVGVLFVISVSLAESVQTFGTPFSLAKQHVVGVGIGLVTFLLGLLTPSRWWIKLGLILYVCSLLLLALVFVPSIGLNLNGAARWISVGGLVFQPVELVKITMIVYLANWLPRHQRLGPFLLTILPAALLLVLQPDVGSLLSILAVAVTLYILAGASRQSLLKLLGLAIPLLIILAVMAPYRLARITTFLNPSADPMGAGFHVRQLSLALGRGGWLGQGVGNSLQKYAYVPESTTDSIFAIIAEEIGFLGCLLIIAVFGVLIYSGFQVASLSPSSSIQLLGYGLVALIGIQASINLAAVLGLLPLTGIPLPFISYGRSAQSMLLLASGMIARMGVRSV